VSDHDLGGGEASPARLDLASHLLDVPVNRRLQLPGVCPALLERLAQGH